MLIKKFRTVRKQLFVSEHMEISGRAIADWNGVFLDYRIVSVLNAVESVSVCCDHAALCPLAVVAVFVEDCVVASPGGLSSVCDCDAEGRFLVSLRALRRPQPHHLREAKVVLGVERWFAVLLGCFRCLALSLVR